jgi:hypothetical protein
MAGKLWRQNALFSKHNIFNSQFSIFHSPQGEPPAAKKSPGGAFALPGDLV